MKSAGAAWARTIPSFILNTYQSHLGETYGMTSHMTRRINLGGGTDVSWGDRTAVGKLVSTAFWDIIELNDRCGRSIVGWCDPKDKQI